ncbi:hypothetical protein BC939DRAFT_505558 [Gamsiella multidivaricata]|uniref:uncharacterized protein n=1 Tax=Gamsiella multidivaricata TaxID=101098 RepID=UPI00221F2A68|nr:uncharacterized protein BC939DRAFT_505558 [Gamsiella multidivaricata]KAI7819722.1 hypothetical protein BC939DRAFT_505558 [Gamsiella multidivaricata]
MANNQQTWGQVDKTKANSLETPSSPVPTPKSTEPQRPSIFTKKKPTVASVGDRPLLKPFNNKFIDYNNPGKDNLVSAKPRKGVPIHSPGFGHTLSTSSNNQTHQSGIQSDGGDSTITQPQTTSETVTSTNAASEITEHDVYTILRIKRKRNEEPLDTLVVQEQLEKLNGKRRKRRGDEVDGEGEKAEPDFPAPKISPAVFRLATTVNKESFKDPTQSIELRDKITHLAETMRPRSRLSDRHIPEFEDRIHERRGALVQGKKEEVRTARYRVINQNRTGLGKPEQLPPVVKSSVEVEAEAALDMFKMYDAVKEEDSSSKKELLREAEESDIMCNFLPMVREYLTIAENVPNPKITVETCKNAGSQDSEDDFVYDIYYRDLHAGHQQESTHRAVGALLWFSDDENNFMNEDDSSEDDYEDSDSNAEDYYQNDYPEDELSDGDHDLDELSGTDDGYYAY